MADVEDADALQRIPLLNHPNKNFYPDCPSCQLELKKAKQNGAPKKELFILGFLTLANVLPISSLFPYIYYLARSFPIVKSDKDIGFYAGFVGSSFMMGRFATSTLWGIFSDKYGRKPVFIIGTLAIIIFNTWFGFSQGFWMAISSRFLLGCLNGILGPVRAYASEICDYEHQSFALALIGTVWGLGLVIGPALGGYLAQPSIQYPSIFPKGSLFDEFPFLLPPLTISAIAVVALLMSFTLPESLHNHPIQLQEEDDDDNSGFGEENNDSKNEKSETENPSLLRNKGLWSSIAVYCIWGLHDMAFSEIFSLWAVCPQEYAGLGFSTSDVGVILAISGGFLLVFQLIFFPPLANLVGAIYVTRIPTILTLPLLAVFPLIGRLHGSWLWVILTVGSIAKNILSSSTTTGSFLLINNAVKISQRGFANGVSVSGMSLFKAIGPATAGVLFSWSQTRLNASFLPGSWVLFTILNVVCLVTVITTFEPFMPRSLDQPVEMQSQEEEEIVKRRASFMD